MERWSSWWGLFRERAARVGAIGGSRVRRHLIERLPWGAPFGVCFVCHWIGGLLRGAWVGRRAAMVGASVGCRMGRRWVKRLIREVCHWIGGLLRGVWVGRGAAMVGASVGFRIGRRWVKRLIRQVSLVAHGYPQYRGFNVTRFGVGGAPMGRDFGIALLRGAQWAVGCKSAAPCFSRTLRPARLPRYAEFRRVCNPMT